MKRTTYISLLAATALALCGCQDGLELESRIESISFNPFVDGVENTEMTKASVFRSKDGRMEIPAWLEVSDGIASMPASDSATPMTKGTRINTTGSSTTLATFASQIGGKFYVTAWKGSPAARFVGGDYATVTYSDGAWSTVSTKWDGTEDATFFAYANLPSSGATVDNDDATTQTLTYSAVPTTASAQTDILLGYYCGTGNPNTTDKTCTAALHFHHPMTAVRFKKGDFSGTVNFKAIYLDGVYKSGKATMTASGSASTISWSDKSTAMQEVGQEGSSYLTVDADYIIGESFLLIPQTITTSAPVTVTLVAEIDGTVHPLTATLAPVDWEAGKTYTYRLSRPVSDPDPIIIPDPGTVLYSEDFGTLTEQQVQLANYNKTATHSYRDASDISYSASGDNFKNVIMLLHDDGNAFLSFMAGYTLTGTWQAHIKDIKPWGARKVRLTFSSFNHNGGISQSCTINGQTYQFGTQGVKKNESFDFNLNGTEETIDIVFEMTKNVTDHIGNLEVDDIVLTFVE